MEIYHTLFPNLVQVIEFFILIRDDAVVEFVTFLMFSFILGFLIGNLLLHELINLRLQEESNVDKFLSHASNIGATSLLLESLEIVKFFSQS
jgi:hypothetical protein